MNYKDYEPRFAKLPKWAQDDIENMERRANAAERKLEKYMAEQEATRIAYGDLNDPKYLPDGLGSTIRFTVDESDPTWGWIAVDITKPNKDGKSELRISAANRIGITPEVSNVIRVTNVERD